MISHEEQLKLFTDIATKLTKTVSCYSFGGTAMMFNGMKSETKDIDLLFTTVDDRQVFIDALKENGFHVSSPFHVYIKRKESDPRAPVMFRRYDVRIDLFAESVFRSRLSPLLRENTTAVHEFGENRNLKLFIVNTESLVYLKGITERDKDFEDIKNIVATDKNFNWDLVVDEALWQHGHGDDWALVDTEKTLQQMRAYMQIEEKHLKRLHDAQRRALGTDGHHKLSI